MSCVVLDTNILVASLWKDKSKSAEIVRRVIEQRLTACFDLNVIDEYRRVLRRFEFRFKRSVLEELMYGITSNGLEVIAPKSDIAFVHESDRMFYDVARHCNAILITANLRHYPANEPLIMTSGAFLRSVV